jgi:phospholipid-transporting ATPase
MFMQMIPEISISNGKPSNLMPLSTVLFVSMVKDAFEDYKRYVNDKSENVEKTSKTFSLEQKEFEEKKW